MYTHTHKTGHASVLMRSCLNGHGPFSDALSLFVQWDGAVGAHAQPASGGQLHHQPDTDEDCARPEHGAWFLRRLSGLLTSGLPQSAPLPLTASINSNPESHTLSLPCS